MAVNRYLDIASDPAKRESVQKRALVRANEMIVEHHEKGDKEKKDTAEREMPAPRVGAQSRFKEHFSLDTTNRYWS